MDRNFCGNLVNEYYVRKFREIARERRKRLAALKNRFDAERYVAEVRTKVRAAFRLETLPRTPLKAQTVSSFDASEAVVCENILFESLPDYPVTGNIYRPRRIEGKIPGVLHLNGHNITGKINEHGKQLNLALAMLGFEVLTVDPVDQGERFRQADNPSSQNVYGHNLIGKRLIGCGSWFGVWRTWDAVRALDYLLSRPEIDPARVYITGCSGGGTMTTLVNAVEDRFAGAVPSCYITSWEHNVENELSVDAEQVPPALSAQGLEMSDLLIAAAPRPVQIMGESDDFFDVRGLKEVHAELKRIYGLLGYEDRVKMFIGPNGHGLWSEQQSACRKFFCGLAGMPGAETFDDSTLPAVADEKLKVLKVPTVFDLPGVKTADQRLKDELINCAERRPVLTESELKQRTAELLKIDLNAAAPDYRVLRPDGLEEEHYSRFLLETEELPLGVLHSGGKAKFQPVFPAEAILYLPHDDYYGELKSWRKEFPGQGIASFDSFLVGEMRPDSGDLPRKKFGAIYRAEYHFAACSLMLDHPVLGLSVEGILGALKLMRADGAEKITLIGAGQSSVTALFAAFLGRELIDRTILVNALPSYAALFDVPNPVCPQPLIAPGVLRIADLPDLYRYVRPELREDAAFPHLDDPVC